MKMKKKAKKSIRITTILLHYQVKWISCSMLHFIGVPTYICTYAEACFSLLSKEIFGKQKG